MNSSNFETESELGSKSSNPYKPPASAQNQTDGELVVEVEVDPEDDPEHSRNFGLATLYMVFMRTGWIFKTESIIMPAVLDVIGGSGWLRGCLPMLNRFGQSVPPLLASDRVKNARFKKFRLFGSTMTMGICFLLLSLVWVFTGGKASWWLPLIFLAIYAVFFSATGINQLVLNTINGKLIRVTRRGQLALLGTVIGSSTAIVAAWFLLSRWLVDQNAGAENQSNFAMIFAFTGTAFVAAAIVALFLKERPDIRNEPHRGPAELFRAAVKTVREDRNFRIVTIIAALFGMYLTLFPHYQRLGRDRLELGLTALIPWVLAQNAGAAMFSIPSGWIADRFGNRLVLRLMMLILCVAPIMALVLARMDNAGSAGFTVVFFLLGLTPVTMRMLNNYTLEVTGNQDHPKYLSTLSIAIAVPPILLSPLFGAMIDWVGFEVVFSIVIFCTFVGWVLTFVIDEPRNKPNLD
ncbi:MAG: MFS transporter [Mariniblastus sp.]